MAGCRDASFAEKVRCVRNHGMEERYFHKIVGGNFRMDGFQGAVLNVKLPHLAGWTARRRAIAEAYRAGIRLEGAVLPATPATGATPSGSSATTPHP